MDSNRHQATIGDLRLDHVGVATADLSAGRSTFENLGFRLTPLSIHSGSTVPGGPVVPWGSGNHCAMFADGYLEILGMTDPSKFSSVKGMLSRYEGLHIVAFGCPEAARAYEVLKSQGISAEAPRVLQREAAFGASGSETRSAEFRNVYLDPMEFPEARFIIIEHMTRDVLWQPHLLAHPNGARAMGAVYLAPADPAVTVTKLARVFGPPTESGGMSRFQLAAGSVFVSSTDALREVCPVLGAGVPIHPVAAARVEVESLARAREWLTQRGVRFREATAFDSGGLAVWVEPGDACGAAFEFTQQEET